MTSIKPPSGPSTTLPYTVGELQGGTSAAAPDGPESVLAPTGGLPAAGIGQGNRVDLVELARAVEQGQLSMAQAVDRLVEGTVGRVPGGQLTDLERAELSALLRQAVQTDPTLTALRNE